LLRAVSGRTLETSGLPGIMSHPPGFSMPGLRVLGWASTTETAFGCGVSLPARETKLT